MIRELQNFQALELVMPQNWKTEVLCLLFFYFTMFVGDALCDSGQIFLTVSLTENIWRQLAGDITLHSTVMTYYLLPKT